jgi:hypothetical protein
MLFIQFLQFLTVVSFLNFNQHIDIFPTNYFVKIYFSKVISEQLGPSTVPLTLIAFNNSEHIRTRANFWCRFFPFHQIFIGSRTDNTLNLIATEYGQALASPTSSRNYDEPDASILAFAAGWISDFSKENNYCWVNTDSTYTIVLANNSEYDWILDNAEEFWSRIGSIFIRDHYLTFHSSSNSTTVCHFLLFQDNVSLNCILSYNLSETLHSGTLVAPKEWKTNVQGILDVPQTEAVQAVSKWKTYMETSTEEILATETLNKANETLIFVPKLSNAFMEESSDWGDFISSKALVDNDNIGFLSCYVEPRLGFQMYVKPFRYQVWIALFSSCSLISLIISLYNRKNNLSESFSSIFFFLSTLVEEPYSVPSVLWNNKVFKTVTLAWLLTAIVFTNVFIGLMISDVTAPVQGKRSANFDEILNTKAEYPTIAHLHSSEMIKFWGNNFSDTKSLSSNVMQTLKIECDPTTSNLEEIHFDSKLYDEHHSKFRSNQHFALLQSPAKRCLGFNMTNPIQRKFLSHPWLYGVFTYLEDVLNDISRTVDEPFLFRVAVFFSPRNRHYPKDPKFTPTESDAIPLYADAAVEKELVACERSVLMGNLREVRYELSYLKTYYPRKHFYISNDTFETKGSNPMVWNFRNGGKSKVPHYFKLLQETGIRNAIYGIRQHKRYLMRRQGTTFIQTLMLSNRAYGIAGSIQTIFIISFACLLIATVAFFFELMYKTKPLCITSKILRKVKVYIVIPCTFGRIRD